MANRKRRTLRSKKKNNDHSVEHKKGRSFGGYFLAFLIGGIVTTGSFFIFGNLFKQERNDYPDSLSFGPAKTFASTGVVPVPQKIRSLNQLLDMTPEELEQIDIALMNLICAKGLNGCESLDINKCLSTIDKWTELIRADTQNRLSLYYQNPAKYDNSENLFKAVNMVLYLKDKLGVHYDPDCVGNWDFSNPDYIFIHGLLDGERSGTCTSIPALCVAIGRRLGYPLELALAKGHVFFRWDGKERFNIEACCKGVDTRDDEYYKKWPDQITGSDIQKGCFLKSLTAKEELSLFIGSRGISLRDNGRFYEAQVAYANACLLMPNNVPPLLDLLGLIDHQLNKIAEAESKITSKP